MLLFIMDSSPKWGKIGGMEPLPDEQAEDIETTNRLSRIATHWASVLMANSEAAPGKRVAKEAVLQRYRVPVFRYLLGAVRDADTAEELAQEFAVRFLWGDFRRVQPQRGRFRDYVKTVLINMVRAHFKALRQQPSQLSLQSSEPAAPENETFSEDSFEDYLRSMLLDRTWVALQKSHPNYHAVLNMRAHHPDLSAREIAEQLSQAPRFSAAANSMSPDVVRKTLQRGRVKFAELLVDEAALLLQCESNEQLRQELQELKLLAYCRQAVDRRSA